MGISYKEVQSRFETIISNKIFEFFIIFVIMASALTVGAKTYNITPFWLQVLEIADIGITVIFVIEITIRFMATHPHSHFFKSGWNVFDTLIVTISLIPIDNTDMALVARLVRVFRVLRMISIIPELRVLLNSLLKALPRLGYVMALMFIIFYIYAAVGSLLFEEINPVLWGDISIAMLTLFRVMTFEDWTDVMYETMAVYGWSWAFYVSFIFLTAFAFLNMVIGVVVNVLEEEHAKMEAADPDHVNLEDLYAEVRALRALLEQQMAGGSGPQPRRTPDT
ncbi:MAG: ion transporter [Pseudomonadales bacterium]|nr:ion transporter [Pseudomonadales bacterium]